MKQFQNDAHGSHHCSYLLRLWGVESAGGVRWQASLEIPETGERLGFSCLEELFAYLMDLTTNGKL